MRYYLRDLSSILEGGNLGKNRGNNSPKIGHVCIYVGFNNFNKKKNF